MPFHEYGKTVKFPRNEHVDIHVRPVILGVDSETPVECVEVREFLKEGEVYGNGIVLPKTAINDLILALQRVQPSEVPA